MDFIEKESVIYPEEWATSTFVYPALSLAERKCQFNCVNGDCDFDGICVCYVLFYGTYCNDVCNGAVVDGECLDVRTVYVGGMVIDSTVEEYNSIMHLAVNMVNNKSDGFFDSTNRIHFEFMMNYSMCDSTQSRNALTGRLLCQYIFIVFFVMHLCAIFH